jgi:hypothetical protein
MNKFLPLDLTAHFNTGRENIPSAPGQPAPWQERLAKAIRDLPGGEQTFWGIPFLLADARADRCWLVLGAGKRAVEISLASSPTPSFILFVHFCSSSYEPNIGAHWHDDVSPIMRPGEHLADYVLCCADGSEYRQPIRRRFEISEPTNAWGQLAFAARAHDRDRPLDSMGPHERGSWGVNQTGVIQGAELSKQRYWVYALPNPHPDQSLTGLRLEATGADTFAIAGITLFYGREHPLRHRRLETMRVTLPNEEAITPGELRADIDLGIVARAYALPSFEPGEWLQAEPKGLGEEPLPAASTNQHLVDVTASPDATLCVGQHHVEMQGVYATGSGQSDDGKVRVELLTPQKTWLRVTILDDSTGLPTPARVHFRAPDGRYLPPYGHRREVNDNWFEDYGGDLKLGSTPYAYVDGRFQIELPVGECYVELSKGYEYEPVRARLSIEPGQQELMLALHPGLRLRQQGWVTADTHVHFLSPQTAWLEAQAEGINLVNLLASQWGDLFTNVTDLTGDQSGVSRDDTIIWVGTENRQHLLGHISLLGVKGSPVFPMCASGPDESYLGDPTWASLAEWADLCRQREGVVVMPHFPNPYGEVVADIILGKVDGVEIRGFHAPTLNLYGIVEWYRFLNLGYRVAAVGGTDKMSAGMPVGGVRTYAQLGDEEFTFANWGRAVRAGRTFTTSGPIIHLEIEGMTPGDEIKLPEGGGAVEIHAHAKSVYPFDCLQVVANGRVIAEEKSASNVREASLKIRIKVDRSSWLAARCLSPLKAWHCWPIHIAAHTSPIYVTVDGQEQFSPTDASYMLTLLEGGMTWLDTLAIPVDAHRHAAIKRVFENAHQQLHQRLHGHNGNIL